jgi:NADH-quinone oxidoreductase subunit L
MTDTLPWILLLLPLASALAIKFALPRAGGIAAIFGTAATAVTFGISLWLLGNAPASAPAFDWIRLPVGDAQPIRIGLFLGPLATAMMVVVTSIGLLVHIFSMGYMKEDAGRARYFAGLSLFMFSMTGIVLSDNFLMMFIFWELVGLSSYILIGHWFHKESAADAAKKAFITNRVGDFGFLTGILLLFGAAGTLDFATLQAKAIDGTLGLSGGMLVAAVLCLFCGAVGKSAQFPLHVWLPDAMEGPTPVSALIHAATMVAAGVYMLVRMSFLLFLPDAAQAANVIAWVGGGTALLAALMATQQDDIKRVLAYSTLSQLGYMVMAVGLLAPAAAFFHLYTHAFFKALLFLGAGAIIHACHHEQDIWKMGGLSKKLPITFATFLAGTAALMAVPFVTSGFWSKEAILAAAYGQNKALFWLAAGVALLTPFYMARLFSVTFFGKARTEDADHAHEVPPVMWAPLLALAIAALVSGFQPVASLFLPEGVIALVFPAQHVEGHSLILGVSIGALVLGAGLGFMLYHGKEKDPVNIPLFRRKFFFDEIYAGLIKAGQETTATLFNLIDRHVVDGLIVGGLGHAASGLGAAFRRLQSGSLQAYIFLVSLGLLVFWWIAASF